jgi:cell filamentation protein
VTFDPFGDFETQGYLRNHANVKDPEIVRHLEHAAFLTGIDAALGRLAKIKELSYSDLLETHKILFNAVYPWAGQDRRTTAPDLAISRGDFFLLAPTTFYLQQIMHLRVGRTKNSYKFSEQDLSALKGNDDLVNQVIAKYGLEKSAGSA